MAKQWKNGKAGGTPLTAAELNRIEKEIEARATNQEVQDLRDKYEGLVARIEGLETLNERVAALESAHAAPGSESARPVEVMPPTPGEWDALEWLQATLEKYGEDPETVTELPFDIDTRNVTNMNRMFAHYRALTSVPQMDTSNVTYMTNTFQNCSSLTSVPQMDTSNVTYMGQMFDGCSSLTSVPDMDTSNVTDMYGMFENCSSLTDGNVRLIGKNPQVNTRSMITGSGLTREPFYDTEGNPID